MNPNLRARTAQVSPQVLSYHLQHFYRAEEIQRRSCHWIRAFLRQSIREGTLDQTLRGTPLVDAARTLLLDERVLCPVDTVLRRLVRSSLAQHVSSRKEERLTILENALGITLRDLPLVKRFEAARRLWQYPPAWKGKANLRTLNREAAIMVELDEIIRTNRLPLPAMLSSPDIERHQSLVERLAPAHLGRREKYRLVEALPFYTVARWRDALDTVLYCFVRKGRLLRSGVDQMEDRLLRDASLAFLERSTPEFHALHRTVLAILETGHVGSLATHRRFLSTLERKGIHLTERETYYKILSGKGGYVRKITRRLLGIPFEGLEPHARVVVEAMKEVLLFLPFRKPVPWEMVKSLGFLDVPPAKLRRRRIFETVIMMTLADLLWSGRVVVLGSHRYRNRWKEVPPAPPSPLDWTPIGWVEELRKHLEEAGARFSKRAKGGKAIKDGRLHVPRPKKRGNEPVAAEMNEEDEESTSPVRLPQISIVDLLWKVHEETGFLDTLRLSGPATKRLPEDERRRLAMGVLMGMGLNLGLVGASRTLGRGFALWRLKNFAANYATEANLREGLNRIIQRWEKLGLGKPWGSGRSCTVDGRAVAGRSHNLVSEVHFRHRRLGVTIYWVVRDDDLAVAVRIIGNHDWESWYVLNDLLQPVAGKVLEASTGDTHGQHLGAWGLAHRLGKRLTVRFRQFGKVKVYSPGGGTWHGLVKTGAVDWGKLRRTAASLQRLVEAVKKGVIVPSEILRMVNLYDEEGVNVMEGLQELGKIARTEFLLDYATNPRLRGVVHRQRQQMEAWNSFQRAVSFGRGGHIETNNPERWAEIGLAMAIVMDAIAFFNAWMHGKRLRKTPSAKPIVWGHVNLMGRYPAMK